MKVIRKGIKPKVKNYKQECNNCGCIFIFKEDEFMPVVDDESKGIIFCPCCHKLFELDK